ncbi:MAG: hypothetical protein KIG88_11820 [Weeksellaceae bacterium]|nr:hypothetical protein [Weeksellaceae bacterium]
MLQFFNDFFVKFYMNTADGSGNQKPPLGFCKIGLLIIFSMILFSIFDDYTTKQVVAVIAGCHLCTFITLVVLNLSFPAWFNKTWKAIAVAVFVPLYTISFILKVNNKGNERTDK